MFRKKLKNIFIIITCFFVVLLQASAYNIGDHTILHHYKNTSKKLTKHPTLWQVTHEFPRGTHLPLSYELLVVYPNAQSHPTLHFRYGPHRFQVNTSKEQLKRLLSLAEIAIQQPPEEIEALQKQFRTLLPFGTFDQISVFPNHSDLSADVFKGLEEKVFSGLLKITEGYPIWQFGNPNQSEWLIEMRRHTFFPTRVKWNGRHRSQSVWTFMFKEVYQPWGTRDPEISQIVYEQRVLYSDTPTLKTTWTLLKSFQKSEEWQNWLKKKPRNTDTILAPLNTQNMKAILASY